MNETINSANGGSTQKRLFRNPDDKKIAGVCSGLASFFDIDVVLIRVLFIIAVIFGTAGFWVYLAIWIIAPEARTGYEKCQLRGIPPTEENLSRFTSK